MTFAPLAPTQQVPPMQIAPDTWQIHHVQEALGQPLFVYLNSMVIKGAEPVIVDTGTIGNQQQWREDVFGLVDPEDVRWVFLSHDDVDHTGNLGYVLDLCPNATLVSSWAITERHTNAFNFPLDRCRWINAGESFSAGDRELVAVRPPLWDSPTTRGLFDKSTGVYWGVDSFACPMPGAPVDSAAAFDPQFWAEGMAMFMYNALSPWLELVDAERYGQMCDRVRAIGMSAIATAHSPLIPEASIDDAFAILRALPSVAAPPAPDQVILEAILSGTPAPAPA
jgi:flavorubredoxin